MAQSLATPELLKALVLAFGGATPTSLGYSELLNDLVIAVQGFSPGATHSPIVRHFPFTYQTANLTTGAALYTPSVGDILHDGWIEVDTAWNGTTPKADIGTFTGATGLYHQAGGVNSTIDMTTVDAQVGNNNGLLGSVFGSLYQNAVSGGPGRIGALQKFTATTPISVCVSTTGATTGANPGATQGSAVLYLVTSTPL